MKIYFAMLLSAVVSFASVASDSKLSPEQKGLEIAKERKARDEGWGNSTSNLTMILRNSQGKESVRALRIKSLEVADEGDKGLTIFDKPLDVKGTAFLNHSYTQKADDQWLFLPALKRIKRIASQNKSGPFMGSEFAYEDLSSFELDKYTFSYISNDKLGEQSVYVLEQTPTDRYSGYSKQKVWIDQQHYRPLKVEYYDRKGSLLKTLTLSDYQKYLEKYWRAHTLEMVNHQTNKSTLLKTEQLAFNVGLTENDFNQASLRRAK